MLDRLPEEIRRNPHVQEQKVAARVGAEIFEELMFPERKVPVNAKTIVECEKIQCRNNRDGFCMASVIRFRNTAIQHVNDRVGNCMDYREMPR